MWVEVGEHADHKPLLIILSPNSSLILSVDDFAVRAEAVLLEEWRLVFFIS
jgi:hypothetical protein